MAKKEYHFIYKTVRNHDGAYYYGMHTTTNINDGYQGSGTLLRRSLAKHGTDAHTTTIIEYLSNRDALAAREREIVNEEMLLDPLCMNLREGGFGGWTHETQRELNKRSQTSQNYTRAIAAMTRDDAIATLVSEGLDTEAASEKIEACCNWVNTKNQKVSRAVIDSYKCGDRIPIGWPDQATILAATPEARAKAKATRTKNGTLGNGEGNSRYGDRWFITYSITERVRRHVPHGTVVEEGWQIGNPPDFSFLDSVCKHCNKPLNLTAHFHSTDPRSKFCAEHTPAVVKTKAKSEKIQLIIDSIKAADVDFTARGWVKKIQPIIGVRTGKVKHWMFEHMPEVMETANLPAPKNSKGSSDVTE